MNDGPRQVPSDATPQRTPRQWSTHGNWRDERRQRLSTEQSVEFTYDVLGDPQLGGPTAPRVIASPPLATLALEPQAAAGTAAARSERRRRVTYHIHRRGLTAADEQRDAARHT